MDLNTHLKLLSRLDSESQKIMLELQAMFSAAGLAVRGRGTHTDGIIVKGNLTVLYSSDVPSHSLFTPGKKYDVIFRHANIVGGAKDDALINGRGSAIRIGNIGDDLSKPGLLDLVLNTGEVFGLPTARLYHQFFGSDFHQKSDMLASGSLRRYGVEAALRNPDSFTELYYHTQLCFEWVDSKKKSRYARFRLLNPNQSTEGGLLDENVEIGPRLVLPRERGDTREKNYLRNEFRQRLTGGAIVEYVLQAQFRSIEEKALDCSNPWDPNTYPWLDIAAIVLDQDESENDHFQEIAYNPGNTHFDLRLPDSYSVDDFASLGVSGALVHYFGSIVRAERTQYLYGSKDDLPGKPVYFPLPVTEIPSKRFLFLLEKYNFLTDKLYPSDGDHDKIEALVSAMPTTALDLAVGSIEPSDIPDSYFLERRLNGYNPGAIRESSGQEGWTHELTHNLAKYDIKPGLHFPDFVQCRLVVDKQNGIKLHSIKIDDNEITPCQKQWQHAKHVYLEAEFVSQELKLHLARCHFNIEQYVMAIKRRLAPTHPVRAFIDPHLEGLMFINSSSVPKIIGSTGFIPIASMLTQGSIVDVIKNELSKLSYMWNPIADLPRDIPGDLFTPAATAYWELLKDYVEKGLVQPFKDELCTEANATQIDELFAELKQRSLYSGDQSPNYDSSELKSLLMYIIYHSSFLHSWANFKQYDDAGNPNHVAMGDYSQYDQQMQDKIRFSQRSLTWVLSSIRYNPVVVYGSDLLKQLIREKLSVLEPGLPLKDLMMSINI
ncbi:MAG: lipoxygenase family protein [Coleofasciculus sp. G1-WW12-02]|uniref:linolenate 9R-lipoxygenase n=1 Tax=unclassified Coleofasciculus TaxID=2692782 RepID=UPI003302FB8C